jgi:hypothetical protein
MLYFLVVDITYFFLAFCGRNGILYFLVANILGVISSCL